MIILIIGKSIPGFDQTAPEFDQLRLNMTSYRYAFYRVDPRTMTTISGTTKAMIELICTRSLVPCLLSLTGLGEVFGPLRKSQPIYSDKCFDVAGNNEKGLSYYAYAYSIKDGVREIYDAAECESINASVHFLKKCRERQGNKWKQKLSEVFS